MAANTAPRFSGKSGFTGGVAITAANTTKDGSTLAAGELIYTAPTDGAFVPGVIAMPLGTNVASVARLWLNNGGAVGTITNNLMVGQISLPATTNSEVAALLPLWLPIPGQFADVAAGHKLYVTIGTSVAAGWEFAASASNWSTA